MRGRFVTWGIGAVCLPLIAVSAFVLLDPDRVDQVLGSVPQGLSEPGPALLAELEHVPISVQAESCAVVGWNDYVARRLDGRQLVLGTGTVLEGEVSTRGRHAVRMEVLNGPHAGELVELGSGAA